MHDKKIIHIYICLNFNNYPFDQEMTGIWNDMAIDQHRNRNTYNGKQAQTEMGWDWINYGARYYDPVVGRWSSVDPKAQSYLSLSPYIYTANNPIAFIDPNGKEIIIALQRNKEGLVTESVTYNNGKLWNSDGSEYTGNNSFAITVMNALNEIRSVDDYTESVVNDLESSKYTHAIAEGKQGENYVNPFNGTFKDGSKMFLGDLKEPQSGAERDAVTSIAHELMHSYDYDNGIAFFPDDPNELASQKSIGDSYSEIRAVNFENRVRENTGRPMRKTYGKNSIPGNLLEDSCKKKKQDCN